MIFQKLDIKAQLQIGISHSILNNSKNPQIKSHFQLVKEIVNSFADWLQSCCVLIDKLRKETGLSKEQVEEDENCYNPKPSFSFLIISFSQFLFSFSPYFLFRFWFHACLADIFINTQISLFGCGNINSVYFPHTLNISETILL